MRPRDGLRERVRRVPLVRFGAGERERRGERESLRERERPSAPGGVRAGVGERPRDALRSARGEGIAGVRMLVIYRMSL